MNIQVITSSYPAYPDDPTGTAGHFVRQFALELANRGHRVTVQPAGKKPSYEAENDISIIPSPWLGGDQELASMSLLSPFNWLIFLHFFVNGIRTTLKLNREHSIERVLCAWAVPSGIFGLAGKLIQNIPYDVWALGSDIWKIRKIPFFGKWILKTVIKNADRVFADGLQLAEEVENLTGASCWFLCSSRKLPLPHEKMFTSEPGGLTHLLFVGRYHPNKGPDLLIRAIACLPADVIATIRLDMFGFGPMREALMRLVADLGLKNRVHVHGPLTAQEFSNYLDSASFLVIPSRIESIPVVFSDALQLGTPVIAMPVGDLGAIIRESGCGTVADEVSPEALATAIRKALTTERDSFLEGVDKVYERFNVEHAVSAWLDLTP